LGRRSVRDALKREMQGKEIGKSEVSSMLLLFFISMEKKVFKIRSIFSKQKEPKLLFKIYLFVVGKVYIVSIPDLYFLQKRTAF